VQRSGGCERSERMGDDNPPCGATEGSGTRISNILLLKFLLGHCFAFRGDEKRILTLHKKQWPVAGLVVPYKLVCEYKYLFLVRGGRNESDGRRNKHRAPMVVYWLH
jgi:hypothetical protein